LVQLQGGGMAGCTVPGVPRRDSAIVVTRTISVSENCFVAYGPVTRRFPAAGVRVKPDLPALSPMRLHRPKEMFSLTSSHPDVGKPGLVIGSALPGTMYRVRRRLAGEQQIADAAGAARLLEFISARNTPVCLYLPVEIAQAT
jgi:hypothetical protein